MTNELGAKIVLKELRDFSGADEVCSKVKVWEFRCFPMRPIRLVA